MKSDTSPSTIKILTVFDDSPQGLLYSGSIHNALYKLLPADFFFSDDRDGAQIEEFLPTFKWLEWSGHFSVFLLCRHSHNAVKFFYEMISRWSMPGKRVQVSSFFATDFKLPELSDETYTICEMVIAPDHLELMRKQLPILEGEIRLGLISVYHANRILEIKGLSADEKTSLIQERILSLLERRPKDFDHDLFTQMQHFLIMCSEEFKAERDHAHMSRIIYVFYLFRKAIKSQIETQSCQRYVHVRVSKTYLHLPFGLKPVLGIFVGLNFLSDNELFEERHLIDILINHFHLKIVENSSFISRENLIHLLYIEVEEGSASEIKLKLPDAIRGGIEKLTHPLFMPKNEEEVLRNIITLSNQLKFARDLPQVIITFDEQTGAELEFTVIWLRIVKPFDLPLQADDTFLTFVCDRVKRVGLLRKKYPKEATVFRVKCPSSQFLRLDHSVDLFKARQAVVKELERIFGEFRDYNGGMIAKQHEQFVALRGLFDVLDSQEELLLENFFHSIHPVELRSLFPPQPLKKLFDLLLKGEKKTFSDDQYCYLLADSSSKDQILGMVDEAEILTINCGSFFGLIYFGQRQVDFLDRNELSMEIHSNG